MAVLTTGAVVLGYVLYRTFAPFPAAPFPAAKFGWIVLAASASVVLGTAVLLVPGCLRGCAAPGCWRSLHGGDRSPARAR